MNLSTTVLQSLLYAFLLLCATSLHSQNWQLTERNSILTTVSQNDSTLIKDNIEMSGTKVSAILYYKTDEEQNLKLSRDVVFPQLRTFNKSNEPDWKKYRAYFRRTISDDFSPTLCQENKILVPSKVDSIEIDGKITFYYQAVNELKLTKIIYPSMTQRLLVEEWQLENMGDTVAEFSIATQTLMLKEKGYKGSYNFTISSDHTDDRPQLLQSGEQMTFSVFYGASIDNESTSFSIDENKASRENYLTICRDNLILKTPDDTLNQLFYFSKIRAAESIFHSSMGPIHSPGGGNYYVGIWANDQVEYSGPFFPYLGYELGTRAAHNAYLKFAGNIPKDDHHIAYAFEVDGNFAMTHLDRGDAAMIAYGTSLYLLNSGDLAKAKQLWPLIEWSLNYCHKNRNEFGAVISESDEMEGRIETGSANLSTSSLYYGGLKFSQLIASSLGKDNLAQKLEERKAAMAEVIENYFGTNIQGLDTYRYFDGNKYLRHWICLPLTMGIDKRKKGTIKALFEKMWTEEGVLVEYKPDDEKSVLKFWDRATLYALRGALKAGETGLAISKLKQYSQKRLLGTHVPYPVEAFPENNMKHLSAESALYCRVFIEGLLGIEPASFSSFYFQPTLPKAWDFIELDKFHLLGLSHDISIQRKGDRLQIKIQSSNGKTLSRDITNGERLEVQVLP